LGLLLVEEGRCNLFSIYYPVQKGARMISPQPTTHPHDLMKPDLFSEILLAATGFIVFVPLLLIVVAALSRSASFR
jgi:hypothetical protein